MRIKRAAGLREDHSGRSDRRSHGSEVAPWHAISADKAANGKGSPRTRGYIARPLMRSESEQAQTLEGPTAASTDEYLETPKSLGGSDG